MNTVIYDVFSVYEYSTDRLSWKNNGARRYHIISYQVSGCYEHSVNGKVLSVCADSLFFINKDDSYTVKCMERGRALCICFSADTDLKTGVYNAKDDVRIGNIFKKIMAASTLEQESNKYLVTAKIYELLSWITARKKTAYVTKKRKERIILAHDAMLENYRKKKFNANVLSEMCGVGQKQFTRLFRDVYGISPTQFVIEMKMNTAAQLIKEGHMSIGEVADFVGYDDVFYFSRLFKKHFSVSPSQYRISQSSLPSPTTT